MTPDQWDDMASVAFGGFEHAFEYLRDTLESIEGPEDFLVYSSDGTRQDFRPEED